MNTLKNLIPGGLQPNLDDLWIKLLPQKQLNADTTEQGMIHCEAMLLALAHNPSLPSTKTRELKKSVPLFILEHRPTDPVFQVDVERYASYNCGVEEVLLLLQPPWRNSQFKT